jgi:hypothetical protein
MGGALDVMVVVALGLIVPALPTPPPMAVESERERDDATPVPTPTAVALWAKAGPVAAMQMAVVIRNRFISRSPPLGE